MLTSPSSGSISIYNHDLQINITIITDFVATTNLILYNNDNTMIKLNFSNDKEWDEISITSPIKNRKPSEIFYIDELDAPTTQTISRRNLLGEAEQRYGYGHHGYQQRGYGYQQRGGYGYQQRGGYGHQQGGGYGQRPINPFLAARQRNKALQAAGAGAAGGHGAGGHGAGGHGAGAHGGSAMGGAMSAEQAGVAGVDPHAAAESTIISKVFDGVREGRNWQDAENNCKVKLGHLASVDGSTQNDQIREECNKMGDNWHCWIGLKRPFAQWTDGTKVAYTVKYTIYSTYIHTTIINCYIHTNTHIHYAYNTYIYIRIGFQENQIIGEEMKTVLKCTNQECGMI